LHKTPVELNNYFTEIRSGSEAGSYLRLIDFAYLSTLGVRVIKKKKFHSASFAPECCIAGTILKLDPTGVPPS